VVAGDSRLWTLGRSYAPQQAAKPRFLPPETKLMSEKSAAGDFFPMD
jgi:hypothetical protein